MSITVPALSSPNLPFKAHAPFLRVSPSSHSGFRIPSEGNSSRNFLIKVQAFNSETTRNFIGPFGKILAFPVGRRLGIFVNAGGHTNEVGGADGGLDEAEKVARGESTMPDRFRYLTKEAPDSPVRWPYFVGLSFCPTASPCVWL